MADAPFPVPDPTKEDQLVGRVETYGAGRWESVSSNEWKSTRTGLEAVTGTGCVMRAMPGGCARRRTGPTPGRPEAAATSNDSFHRASSKRCRVLSRRGRPRWKLRHEHIPDQPSLHPRWRMKRACPTSSRSRPPWRPMAARGSPTAGSASGKKHGRSWSSSCGSPTAPPPLGYPSPGFREILPPHANTALSAIVLIGSVPTDYAVR